MERQYFSRAMLVACVTLACWATAAQALPVLIAQTGFEVAEGYPAPPPAYDVRSSSLTLTDGAGWGGNTWAGNNGGAAYTYVAGDITAYDGSQYLVMHRAGTNEIRLRRKYDTSLIQDNRVALAAAFRLDASATAANYFDSAFNISLEWGLADNLGQENLRVEFTKEGMVKVKSAGSSIIVGYWDDPNGQMYALNTWATIELDGDLDTSTYDVWINGNLIGNYPFNKLLNAGETLNQIRFRGPRGFSTSTNDGVSIDAVMLTTVPEPAALALLALGVLIGRRRMRA